MSVFTFVVGQPHHTVGTLQTVTGQSLNTATFSLGLAQEMAGLTVWVPVFALQPHPIAYHLVLGFTFLRDEEGTPMPSSP